MMINKLRIRKVASYDESGVELNDLKKINFFFGYNGSGKSTIARYLYDLSLPESKKNSNYNFCSQEGYDPQENSIVVFDEDFKCANFIEKESLKGIFTLNEKNEFIDSSIKKYNSKIQEIKKAEERQNIRYQKNQDKSSKMTKDILDLCFSKRAVFDSYSKLSIPNSRNKKKHLEEIRGYLVSAQSSKSIDEILQEYKRIYDNSMAEISINIDINLWSEILEIESELEKDLNKIIIGNNDVDIAELIIGLNASSWVEKGRKFVEKTDGKCPFCQQNINDLDSLKEKFNLFFDEDFKKKVERIKELGNLYYTKTSEIKNCINDIVKEVSQNKKFLFFLDKFTKIIDVNIQIIKEKIENPNEKKVIEQLCCLTEEITELKRIVTINNRDFFNLNKLKEGLLKDCWLFLADKSKVDIEKYDRKSNCYRRIFELNEQKKEKNRRLISFYRRKLEDLRRKTINTTEAVDEINKILKNVGFNDFSIEERRKEDNISQYYLKRKNSGDSEVFKTLSEGEKTFISFLYFYQLCIGTSDIKNDAGKKKIIVIDDPVSSLDSQILFIVTTLIHKLLRKKGDRQNKKYFFNPNIIQALVFTHNFYFYKEVSLERRPICSDVFHYKISKAKSVTSITGSKKSDITDDYSLMWATLKNLKSTLNEDKSVNLMLANLMRRIIDTYIEFIGMKSGNPTWSALNNTDINSPEYIVESAFISCINDESHSISPLDDEYYNNIIRENPSVLFSAFSSIFRKIGKDHYEMMMEESFDE